MTSLTNVTAEWSQTTTGSLDVTISQVDNKSVGTSKLQVSKGKPNCRDYIMDKIYKYQKEIHNETIENGWDGEPETGEKLNPKWTFAAALLYSVTAITTIGKRGQYTLYHVT